MQLLFAPITSALFEYAIEPFLELFTSPQNSKVVSDSESLAIATEPTVVSGFIPVESRVVPKNAVASVYGEYRNQLSVKCEDISVLVPKEK